MNKDFWERIDRLEELAGKATQTSQWDRDIEPAKYFEIHKNFEAAANPAMILEMIAEMRKLEKEADWLVDEIIMSESKKCPLCDCPQKAPDSPTESESMAFLNGCRKCWREAAHKAVSEADNAVV